MGSLSRRLARMVTHAERCERPGCFRDASYYVGVGLELHDDKGSIVAAPLGYRCKGHASQASLLSDFDEDARQRYERLFRRGLGGEIPTNATTRIGPMRISKAEIAALKTAFALLEGDDGMPAKDDKKEGGGSDVAVG
jgi:hypothetical protein